MINYRKQKKFNVILIKVKNLSLYIQRQTNKLLCSYKTFIKTYVNNIIIHFNTLQKHLIYLYTLFNIFYIKRINLIVIQTFLNYFLIILLKQQINSLNIFIIVKKIVVIMLLRFSLSLRNLKIFIKLID